jgi:microcystin degradation protein MlrC
MRIAVACLWQETNSFNRFPTGLSDFETFGLHRGDEMLTALEGSNEVGGVISAARSNPERIELVPILRAWGAAGGPLSAETHRTLREDILTRLQDAGHLDGLVLLLHGACAAEGLDDVEGDLIHAARTLLGPGVPIVVSLDHHANVTRLMAQSADGLVGHRSEPHDPYETAKLATQLLVSIVNRAITPAMALRKIPMITHQEQFLTATGPMRTWFDRAREMEAQPGVVSASPFPMQPWLDVTEGGWATIVITDRDQRLAEQLAGELADLAWSLRHDFATINSLPPAEAVDQAAAASGGLAVVSDMGDVVWGGATGDSTCLLQEVLNHRSRPPALIPIWDPEVAHAASAAGLGAEMTVEVGGKRDSIFSTPYLLQVTVTGLRQEPLELDGSFYGLKTVDQGVIALLEVGDVKLVVSEKRGLAGSHPLVYRQFGVEPRASKLVVVKTAANVHPYAPMTSVVIRADTPGVSQSRLDQFHWRRLPRPLFGLDAVA